MLSILSVLAIIALLFFADRLLMPKYMSGVYEGALIAEYYQSEKNHQLIILGDCEAYENISPFTLWEEYGYTSFIRGSPQQLIWQSYYLLEDTLRHETPDAVIFSVFGMKYDTPQSEAYNRLTLDGMKLSRSKIAAVRASLTEGESFLSYFVPLLRFHDRWKDLSADDWRYMFGRRGVSFNGYMMRCDVKPMGTLPTPQELAEPAFGEVCWDYLDQIRELCERNGIELILFKAPVPYPYWHPEWDAQIGKYAERHGLTYVNALNHLEEIGIDYASDTYDGGLHLNLWGAEKMSVYLGGLLQGLDDLRGDNAVSKVWAEKAERYHALIAVQTAEIETVGKVMSLTRE
ncbi:MAG: SGNH/GDSL hydrolase family protein [Oscillospiraceae bacterium]|nr:SGNH/GDSL hydrolase family protein [Oscillospiraceae bacterium]